MNDYSDKAYQIISDWRDSDASMGVVAHISAQEWRDLQERIARALRIAFGDGLEAAAQHVDVPWGGAGSEFAAAIRSRK